MAKTTRAPRRSPEQIARDDLAMTEALLAKAEARTSRLTADLVKAEQECHRLAVMRDYQAAHPLLTQERLPDGGDDSA